MLRKENNKFDYSDNCDLCKFIAISHRLDAGAHVHTQPLTHLHLYACSIGPSHIHSCMRTNRHACTSQGRGNTPIIFESHSIFFFKFMLFFQKKIVFSHYASNKAYLFALHVSTGTQTPHKWAHSDYLCLYIILRNWCSRSKSDTSM